ncbi:DUF4214 domain-containing protein [Massilia pseudoviolaceinigra]|uniref:DUF4214 domain-containing protein n=1 Tax=Massilia pseudoviolaceinigra TaxID=3057165 RepID=UPI002796788E|nr:DUF4214 domain-containing protein [Massilia sp. CCM 9206]MDQ1919320.1 DUF4214 domain-containing protein [Massilia sp. CCM 9206]
MNYITIDYLSDLTAQQMLAARTLTFTPTTADVSTGWDVSALFTNYEGVEIQNDLFSFTGVANAKYDVFTHSTREPSMIRLYDHAGNVIAIDNEKNTSINGDDFLHHFMAPYSGTYYVAAGWTEVNPDPFLNLSIYANLDPVQAPVNTLRGAPANDHWLSTFGNDIGDGGDGFDTFYAGGGRGDFNLVSAGDMLTVTSRFGTEGVDTLKNVEKIAFWDGSVDMTYIGLTQALYVGYFGRPADVGGLKSFQSQLAAMGAPEGVREFSARYATDAAVKNLIDSFGTSVESNALYAGDNKTFVKAIFNNVLNRAPSVTGLEFWSAAIDSGELTRANASLSIMAGALANTSIQGQNDARLVEAKIDVASNFTFALESDSFHAAYDRAGAATIARNLLGTVGAATDPNAFQPSVYQAILKLPQLPPADLAHPGEQSWAAQPEAPPILLVGMDSSVDGVVSPA